MSKESLLRRQQALLKTLTEGLAEPAPLWPVGLCAPEGVAGGLRRGVLAYRGNAQVLADKVLAQAFPRLRQELGEAGFAAMAWACWRHSPPSCGDLGEWGAALPGFLAEQPEMEGQVLDLARLEWALHSVARARDETLDAASMALLAEWAPHDLTLVLRAGTQVLEVDARAWAIWQGEGLDGCIASEAAPAKRLNLLVWRLQWRAEVQRVSRREAVFLGSLLQGMSLEAALTRAQLPLNEAEPDAEAFDFSACLQAALRQGWLRAVRLLGQA